MDGAGWQWYDESTREAGYTAVIAPDGKCCWDTFSDQFAARNYTLEGPSETSGPWDYAGLKYERMELCERSSPFMPTWPPLPPAGPLPPDVPSAPPFLPNAPLDASVDSSPRPPVLPTLPGISPLRPNAPPNFPSLPGAPGKWAGAWPWRPHLLLTTPSPNLPEYPQYPEYPYQPETGSRQRPPFPPEPPPDSPAPSLPPAPPSPPSPPPRPPRPPRPPSSPPVFYGPWDSSKDLNEQHKAVLRFILSGDTSFWSRPEVATRIGFGTAPWRCVNNCQAQYYASAQECAPDCATQTYCEPGGAALSDPNTTCCALSLLDQSYSFSHPPSQTTPDWCSAYPTCSLRHSPAWHHPSIDLTQPPEFSLVDDLVCLPLEEIYFEDVSFRPEHELLAVAPDRSGPDSSTEFDLFNATTWKCDRMDSRVIDLADFGFPGETAHNLAPSYFIMMLDPCGVGRALVSRNVSSLNPNLALRNVAMDKCLFAPFTELNAMRWSGRARLEWSEELRKSLESVKYGNQSYPRGIPPPVPDPVATRPFLPDTLKRITIKRTLDGRHPSQIWRSRPVVQGFLPSEWALLRNLEYLDLSDETGQGLIEGPIPSTWLMMTKLRTMIVSYQIQIYIYQTPYGAVWGLPKRYYGPIDWANRTRQWNVTVFDMDGAGWQWYDASTGEAGYTAIIAPDGKCCWDTFSDQFAARNYTLEGPSETSGPMDYAGLKYERMELYEWQAATTISRDSAGLTGAIATASSTITAVATATPSSTSTSATPATNKAVLRFILSGDTSFWSRPEVATRIGFGTAPWRCVNNCQAQYYASAQECAPDCTTQTYCVPGGAALSHPNTTCCALSLLDQSYSFSHPPNATTPDWCSSYPAWGRSSRRPSVCDFNAYTARGAVPPGGAADPLLAVSCKNDKTVTFHVNGTQYRNDTARRIIYDGDIGQKNTTRNVVSRISLRHTPAWHHPSIDLTRPPVFSLVDDLVCLPLEEIYFEDVSFRPEHALLAVAPDRSGPNGTTFDLFNHTTWNCDRLSGQGFNLSEYGFPKEAAHNRAPSYFSMILDPCGVGRALLSRNVSSLNPNLALRNVAMDKCLFAPFTELNAMRWSGRARLEWSEELRKSLESVKYGNQSYPRGIPPPVPDPVAARPFLPDTLKRITIKRTLDGRHPSQTWRSRPVVQGFLPSEWALFANLEHLDLSDETGRGLIEGPIPSTWLMMTKLRTM
ncbi:hypothetical protein PLESTB_000107900 [Pleodorina starrii]|uniref:Uncharacterized protein n=1 Tax=Pleodorina starrii TaxID=330485 RepID=A0A9W6BAJ4_9CHLO|nr:hypothetical protein PLESTB_000107900 [Pleodorina starrii]